MQNYTYQLVNRNICYVPSFFICSSKTQNILKRFKSAIAKLTSKTKSNYQGRKKLINTEVMTNLLALCLVFISLFAAEVWSPSPAAVKKQDNQKVDDVIMKECHRVVVVESFDQNGQQNTKVSILPEQAKEQEGKASSGLIQNAKEKIKEASHVLPNLGQGISDNGHEYADREAKPTPRELICDAFGNCTHRIARAINKVKDKVSGAVQEVAQEAMESAEEAASRPKEMAYESKERVNDAYEKAKEAAAQKAYDVNEKAEDVYQRAKETATHKAQDVKGSAKESLNKAKHTGKTIGKAVALDMNEKIVNAKEKVEEKAKEAKQSTKQATHRVGGLMNRAVRYVVSPEALKSLMGVVHMLGFAIAYGMCVWVTFASSYVLAGALPRLQFGLVQSKIYPVYFTATVYCIGVALFGHLVGHLERPSKLLTNNAETLQAFNLMGSVSLILINLLYLEPLATKTMFERMKIEKEEGRGRENLTAESSKADEQEPGTNAAHTSRTGEAGAPAPEKPELMTREQDKVRARIVRTNKRLKTLNSYSSLLNIMTLMALTWHLVYLGQYLHVHDVVC